MEVSPKTTCLGRPYFMAIWVVFQDRFYCTAWDSYPVEIWRSEAWNGTWRSCPPSLANPDRTAPVTPGTGNGTADPDSGYWSSGDSKHKVNRSGSQNWILGKKKYQHFFFLFAGFSDSRNFLPKLSPTPVGVSRKISNPEINSSSLITLATIVFAMLTSKITRGNFLKKHFFQKVTPDLWSASRYCQKYYYESHPNMLKALIFRSLYWISWTSRLVIMSRTWISRETTIRISAPPPHSRKRYVVTPPALPQSSVPRTSGLCTQYWTGSLYTQVPGIYGGK